MSLVLEHRWEHALVAATIDAASKQCPTCFLGRTAIQKLLYFMKVRGVPMKYSFDIHHYGPFCANIMHDVDWLMTDGVIEDQASEARYSNYRPSAGWHELEEQFHDDLAENQEIISEVCEAMGELTPEALELVATLDFSYRWVRARGGCGPWKNATIEKFKRVKKDRFSDEAIEESYETLVEAGLIEE